MNSGTIDVTGKDNDEETFAYGVYDNGGTVNINSGNITATSGAGTVTEDEYNEPVGGNAYALYSAEQKWNKLTIAEDENGYPVANIRANSVDRLLVPELWGAFEDGSEYALYTSQWNEDGYYSLTIPN